MTASGIDSASAAHRVWRAWPATRRGETLAAMAHHLPEQLAARAVAWAGRADKIYGQHHQGVPGELSYRVRDPLGVVALVVERPDEGALTDLVFAALACGNAVVTVAEEAMLPYARKLAEVAGSGGIAGLVTVLTGKESETIAARTAVPAAIAGVQLVGEEHDARRLAAVAWPRPVRLHAGSRPAHLVLSGADLHRAAEVIAQESPGAMVLAEHDVAAALHALLASAGAAGVEAIEFTGDAELLELTGDGSCGPSVSLWTRDLARMFSLANTLHATDIACNQPGLPAGAEELIESLTRVRRVSLRYR